MKSFLKGPPPEKAELKRWWTYLSQFRLTVHLRLGTFCEIGNRLLFKLQILQPVIGRVLHFKTGTYRLLGV